MESKIKQIYSAKTGCTVHLGWLSRFFCLGEFASLFVLDQGINHGLDVSIHKSCDIVVLKTYAVVCNSALGEIVGAHFFASFT